MVVPVVIVVGLAVIMVVPVFHFCFLIGLFDFFESRLTFFWNVFSFSIFTYQCNISYASIFIDPTNYYTAIRISYMYLTFFTYFPLTFFGTFFAINITLKITII